MRILTIKWRMMGKWLAFGGRGTYNPANPLKGVHCLAFEQVPCFWGRCGKPETIPAEFASSNSGQGGEVVVTNT